VAWAKNQKKEVIDIVKKLLDARGFNQGLTLSVQSLDLDVTTTPTASLTDAELKANMAALLKKLQD
jgi:hypothetical protein